MVFKLFDSEVTNLLTLNLRHGGSIAVRGRFRKRNAASSAARGGVRQGASVAGASRAAGRASGPRLSVRAFSLPRFPGAVRRAHRLCAANSDARAGPLFKRDERAPFSSTVARSSAEFASKKQFTRARYTITDSV